MQTNRHQPGQSGVRPVLRCLGVALWLVAFGGSATAAVINIPATPTTMTSNAIRMISYRHQDHMWQTSDGATHVFVNRGSRSDGRALSMNSTFDNGATWVSAVATLPNTDSKTTSDGYLDDDNLYVTYSSSGDKDIRFAQFRYNSSKKTWSLVTTQVVFSSGTITKTLTPAVAPDAMGRLWLAFTGMDKSSKNYSIKLMRKDPDAAVWVDTGFVFGPVDTGNANGDPERSGRPIATANGIGMVFTVHADTYWAVRDNRAAPTAAWARSLIYTSPSGDADPYGSHYSIVADAQKNLHMASVDGGSIVYSRYLATTKTWTSRKMTNDARTNYVQAAVSLGNLVVIGNNDTMLRVYQSKDGGNNFVYTQQLTHTPSNGSGPNYSNPRMEMPAQSSSPVPVLQQWYETAPGGIQTQHLMFFAVPVIR